ncbi:hypothetical protein MY04_4053 [Flammeovirga sp. MY04]|uniref:hypothetical protein n=1 Tax=Flammeovirga sp. MY04 TaxID=1191459 RepID=UPI000806447B|nr:hypothetical protein [Flammeovirga sp. MY04]ANQ51397.1 hypothetical protein MY04_4053 [Flammeovirga sp. MY04]
MEHTNNINIDIQFETNFWTVNKIENFYFIQWENKAGREMTDEEFKEHINSLAKLISTQGVANNINAFMVDTRLYHYTMNLDLQTWHDNEIIPGYIKNGIKRIAFILSGNLIQDLSIEQTFDEEKAQSGPLEVKYFTDSRTARSWVEKTL